jgi:hypothetical protein
MSVFERAWSSPWSARIAIVLASSVFVLGCPMDDDPAAPPGDPGALPDAGPTVDAAPDAPVAADAPSLRPTHSGLVSVQDISIANIPAAGHGLTVNVFFNAARAPDYEEKPGELGGCRVWSYDLAQEPVPPLEDHGAIRLTGADGGPLTCTFAKGRGYVCPTSSGAATATLTAAENGTTKVTLAKSAFGAADLGRYLDLRGATTVANSGTFAILGAPSPTDAILLNPRAAAESFEATFTVLAGAGPVPNDLSHPFKSGAPLTIALTPSAGSAFAFPDTTLQPGEAFTVDEASGARIMAVPVTGEAMTLACGTCGKADGSIVRITTTDADVSAVSPAAMPDPKKRYVEISCVGVGTGSITVPAPAMTFLRKAHEASPITRIRTAFMRDGLASLVDAPPRAPNRVSLVAGRGLLGYTKP